MRRVICLIFCSCLGVTDFKNSASVDTGVTGFNVNPRDASAYLGLSFSIAKNIYVSSGYWGVPWGELQHGIYWGVVYSLPLF